MSRKPSQSQQPEEKIRGSNETTNSDAKTKKSILSARKSSAGVPIPSTQKRTSSKAKEPFVVDELPPCRMYRTRSSLDHMVNPIDQPKLPTKYVPPYRRNFRYFGYPQNLNLDVNTPPRVKSWGSNEHIPIKSKPKRRTGFVRNAHLKNADFDPHWMDRLLKSNLLLENPGLIPPTDNAAINKGNKQALKLIHPDFEIHNCPSDLFFPITPKSRKAFCKINRMVQDKLDKQMHAYSVQNPTIMKLVNLEQEVLKDEAERKSKQFNYSSMRRSTLRERRKSNFQLTEFKNTSEEDFVSHYESAKVTSPVIKTLCVENNYPGINRQVYARPKELDDRRDNNSKDLNDTLIYGIARIPQFSLHMPEDLWMKLATARNRQSQLQKNAQLKKQLHDPDFRKFQTFTQLELRDQVLQKAREDFMERLKDDLNASLPPELFKDNRDEYQPHHDYFGKGELPAQGPYYYKIENEAPASEEEKQMIEKFMEEAKEQHENTHHLPGLSHTSRHPFQKVELDWMEKGSEMGRVFEPRKTPIELQEMPAFMMTLGKDRFEEKFNRTVREGAKELVGPEIWDLYKRTFGIQELSKEQESTEEEVRAKKEMPTKKRMIRRQKKRSSSISPGLMPMPVQVEEEEEDEDEDEDEEGDEEEEEEHEEEEELEMLPSMFTAPVEPEYRLSVELLEDEEFPLPDVRFSLIEFPKGNIPEGLKEEVKHFKKDLERGEPVRMDEEEIKGEISSSSTAANSEEDTAEMGDEGKSNHNALSHLQVMYQDAVRMKHKSFHFPIQKQHELEPPNLKDVFLAESYADDIENLLNPVPKYSKT